LKASAERSDAVAAYQISSSDGFASGANSKLGPINAILVTSRIAKLPDMLLPSRLISSCWGAIGSKIRAMTDHADEIHESRPDHGETGRQRIRINDCRHRIGGVVESVCRFEREDKERQKANKDIDSMEDGDRCASMASVPSRRRARWSRAANIQVTSLVPLSATFIKFTRRDFAE
jgi:hypothetical protein